MNIFRRRKERIRELDQRVADAQAEADLSERRLHKIRGEVVHPLSQRGSHNKFADLIRDSLAQPRSHGSQ